MIRFIRYLEQQLLHQLLAQLHTRVQHYFMLNMTSRFTEHLIGTLSLVV